MSGRHAAVESCKTSLALRELKPSPLLARAQLPVLAQIGTGCGRMVTLRCLTTLSPHDPQGLNRKMLNQAGSLDPSRGFNAQFGQQQGNGFALGEEERACPGAARATGAPLSESVSRPPIAGNIAGALQAGGMQASQLGVR